MTIQLLGVLLLISFTFWVCFSLILLESKHFLKFLLAGALLQIIIIALLVGSWKQEYQSKIELVDIHDTGRVQVAVHPFTNELFNVTRCCKFIIRETQQLKVEERKYRPFLGIYRSVEYFYDVHDPFNFNREEKEM